MGHIYNCFRNFDDIATAHWHSNKDNDCPAIILILGHINSTCRQLQLPYYVPTQLICKAIRSDIRIHLEYSSQFIPVSSLELLLNPSQSTKTIIEKSCLSDIYRCGVSKSSVINGEYSVTKLWNQSRTIQKKIIMNVS